VEQIQLFYEQLKSISSQKKNNDVNDKNINNNNKSEAVRIIKNDIESHLLRDSQSIPLSLAVERFVELSKVDRLSCAIMMI